MGTGVPLARGCDACWLIRKHTGVVATGRGRAQARVVLAHHSFPGITAPRQLRSIPTMNHEYITRHALGVQREVQVLPSAPR